MGQFRMRNRLFVELTQHYRGDTKVEEDDRGEHGYGDSDEDPLPVGAEQIRSDQ